MAHVRHFKPIAVRSGADHRHHHSHKNEKIQVHLGDAGAHGGDAGHHPDHLGDAGAGLSEATRQSQPDFPGAFYAESGYGSGVHHGVAGGDHCSG